MLLTSKWPNEVWALRALVLRIHGTTNAKISHTHWEQIVSVGLNSMHAANSVVLWGARW